MEPTALDWVLLAVAGFAAAVGLFRGLSGEMGALVGLVASVVAGYFLFTPISSLMASTNAVTGIMAQKVAAAALDAVASLAIYHLSRKLTAKFFSFILPQPFNALIGCAIGWLKGCVLIGVLLAANFVQTGRMAQGFFSAHSRIVSMAGTLADGWFGGSAE